MAKQFDSWVKKGNDVYQATADDTSREFYENTFLIHDFKEAFCSQLRFIPAPYIVYASAEKELTKRIVESDSHSWRMTLPGEIQAILIDPNERILVATGKYLKIFDTEGVEQTSVDLTDTVTGIAYDKDLNIYASTTLSPGALFKLDSEGNYLWDRQADSNATAYSIVRDVTVKSNGQSVILVSEGTLTYDQPYTVNADGTAWINSQGDDQLSVDHIGAMYCPIDSQGNIYVLEGVNKVIKHDPQGGVLWSTQYSSNDELPVAFNGAIFDKSDNLYFLATEFNGDPQLRKVDPSDGSVLWQTGTESYGNVSWCGGHGLQIDKEDRLIAITEHEVLHFDKNDGSFISTLTDGDALYSYVNNYYPAGHIPFDCS